MQKNAIACQGGSLHAAFTAGALKQILSAIDQMPFNIMGLSGTSAGALCAVGCWYGLHQGGPDVASRTLDAIWHDFAACLPAEQMYNEWLVSTMRLQGRGILPNINLAPITLAFRCYSGSGKHWACVRNFWIMAACLKSILTLPPSTN